MSKTNEKNAKEERGNASRERSLPFSQTMDVAEEGAHGASDGPHSKSGELTEGSGLTAPENGELTEEKRPGSVRWSPPPSQHGLRHLLHSRRLLFLLRG